MESEIKRLHQKLETTEDSLQKAAEYGLLLLNDKIDLQNKLEDQQSEMTSVIEGLEQEKYSLQRQVELKAQMLDSLNAEFDIVKNQQMHLLEEQQAALERKHAVECSEYKNKVDKLKGDLDEVRLLEKQLQNKLELQSQILITKTEELRKMTENAHDSMSSEILELQIQKMDLESAMDALQLQHQELKCKEQQLGLANCNLQKQLETLKNSKEESEKEAVSLYNALEKSRQANQELQVQLDQVLHQAQDPNSKGNSLFSEVEDKRAEMERQLISVKTQYQSLQKQYAFNKQQMLRMKVQISNVMRLQCVRADPAQLERLQFMLLEKNNEIETLMKKVKQLEQAEAAPSIGVSKEVEVVDETYYIDLLKMQLLNSKKAAETLKVELSMARMKALSESHRVLELERKLFAAENALKQGRVDIIKLQVRNEELQMKYEPNEVNKAQAQRCRREKFPVHLPDGTEYSSLDAPDVKTEPSQNEAIDAKVVLCSTENEMSQDLCSSGFKNVPVTISESSRSSVKDTSITANQKLIKREDNGDNWRVERCKKYQEPVHVNSENTLEKQCAQQ